MTASTMGAQRRKVRAYLEALVDKAENGATLPTYKTISSMLECSQAPVREVMADLAREGRVTLQRGRPARVRKFISFSESAKRMNLEIRRQSFNAAYLPVSESDSVVRDFFGLGAKDPCLTVSRIFSNREKEAEDWKPVAFHRTFINPNVIDLPARFFLDNDPNTMSLSSVYTGIGCRPEQSTADIQAGLASPEEQDLLSISDVSPVMRSQQTTLARRSGSVVPLEYLFATYTSDILLSVNRLNPSNLLGDAP